MKLGKIGIAAAILAMTMTGSAFGAETAEPSIYGKYGVVIDADTGEILFDKNAKEKWYPASLTKVLTAIMLTENVKDGELIEATAYATGQEASNPYFKLKPKETISKENALYAMMVISANDVATAVGEKIGGTPENFGKMMTQKAKELGAENSNFVTASGLHDPNHQSTAYDMALIAKEAIKNPQILNAMGTKEVALQTSGQQVEVKNPSKVRDNPMSLGGKTGYTDQSLNNLIEVFQKDGKTVVAVVMKSGNPQEYSDLDKMANYAFQTNAIKKLYAKGQEVAQQQVDGEKVSLSAAEDFSLFQKTGAEPAVTTAVKMNEGKGEIKKGEVAGYLEVVKDGKKIKDLPLIADKDIRTKSASANAPAQAEPAAWKKVALAVGLPLPFYAAYLIRHKRKKRERSSDASETNPSFD